MPADKLSMDFLGSALQGLQQAQGWFQKTAQHVAQAGLNTPQTGTSADSVSLSDEAVSLMSAQNLYEADLGAAHTGKQMEKATLSLLE